MRYFIILSALLMLAFAGCVTKNTSKRDLDSFQNALAQSDKDSQNAAAAQKGIARFKKLFVDIKNPHFREMAEDTYAKDAYLNDTLVELHGSKAIAAYLVETAKNSDSLEMIYKDLARSGNNYYLRWVMIIRSKTFHHGEPVYSTGVTLFRFDREGRITVHRDYWDSASGFYKHLPVMGPEIQFIQSRLGKN